MKKKIKELREKYILNPPEGMTSEDIRHMSEENLLDMDYFLNEDVFGDDFGEEGFYISFGNEPKANFPINQQKSALKRTYTYHCWFIPLLDMV